MSNAKITITGTEKVNAFLNKKKREMLFNLAEGIQAGGKQMKSEIVDSIGGLKAEPRSVATGEFRSSVRERKTGPYENTTSSSVKQAKFMEHGTIHIPARRHFSNSSARLKNKIISDIKKKIL